MTPPAAGPKRRRQVTVSPVTVAVVLGVAAAAGVYWAPLAVVYAFLVGWLVAMVTLLVVGGR